MGEIEAHGLNLLISQSQLIVKRLVEFLTSVMLRKESYEPVLDSVGACRWKMVCQGIQALPQAAGPVVIFQPYSPIVQINDRPLFRSPAMTKVMAQGLRFICKYPPEWSAAFSGSERKSLREAAVLIFPRWAAARANSGYSPTSPAPSSPTKSGFAVPRCST